MAIQDVYQAVLNYDRVGITDLVAREIEAGADIPAILNDGLIAAMDEVGRRFEEGSIFVPQMLVAGRAMRTGLEVLRPYLTSANITSKGTIVFGTVKGDVHDIGKNLVILMLEGAGFKVIDLGVDVDQDLFLSTAKENSTDIVAMSALLTTTMPSMERAVALIESPRYSRSWSRSAGYRTLCFSNRRRRLWGRGGWCGSLARDLIAK